MSSYHLTTKVSRLLHTGACVLTFCAASVTPTYAQTTSPPPADSTQPTGAKVTYPIVDTGQTKCYDNTTESTCPAAGAAFYGQDAQYAGNQPNYTLSSDSKTVSDNNTGLTWMRGPNTTLTTPVKADKMTYTAAQTWVTTVNHMNYGGYSDWRLPTIKELYSLIQFNGTDPSGYSGTDTSALTPFIDTTKFNFAYGQTSSGERIIDSQYASSNAYVFNPSDSEYSKLFGVNFADGRIKGYDLKMPGGSEKTFFVQLVRGNTNYGVNNFTDNGDQTVTDNATGLMWSKPDSGSGLNWQDALAFIQTKNAENYLGHNDWRLPNVKELQSILDYTRSPDTTSSAAINPIFTVTQITNEAGNVDYPWYWSNTTHATYNGIGAGAYIAFGRAGGWQKATTTATCYTLDDVHGAGAQRSDPKTTNGISTIGDTCNGGTAYGFGPQGDVQRAANYVRLVRDASATTSTLPTTTETETTTTPETETTTTPPTTTETGTTTTPEMVSTETCFTVPWTPTGIYRGQNQWGVLSIKSSSPQELVATDDGENPYFSHTTKGVSTSTDSNGAKLYTNCTDSPPNTFKMETTRVDRETGCVTVLYGVISFMDDSHAEYKGNGSDGLCDVSNDFVETIIFLKDESLATETTPPPPTITETGTITPPETPTTGTTTIPPTTTDVGTTTTPVTTTTETTTTIPVTTGTTTTMVPPTVVSQVAPIINMVSDCTGSSTVSNLCNGGGKTITVTEIKPGGMLSNGILNNTLTNQGWISNVKITANGKLVGGVVTGYIKNEGVIMEFEFKGASIIGGTLGGKIRNTSKVGGFFMNVTLLANAQITGGTLKGTIKGDKNSPALLEKVRIKKGSHLSGVKLGKDVKLEKGVIIEDN